jgi:hypothetical protein
VKTKFDKSVVWGFAIFVSIYALLIVSWSNFGPTDDVAFMTTVMRDHLLVSYSAESRALGRFAPAGGQEYNLLVWFDLPKSPYVMFAINVAQFAVTMLALIALLRDITPRKSVIAAIIIVFLLLPGSIISWFRLSVGERGMVFYLTIFVFSYLRFLRDGKLGFMAVALLAGNAVIYCKEPMFLAMGAFAFTHLVATWKAGKVRQRTLDGLLIASAVAFIVLYYFLIYLHRGPHLYSDTHFNPLIVFTKNLSNYAFFSDPVIVLVLWPFTAWRLIRILRTRGADYSVHDSLLLAGTTYSGSYLLLNMYQPYYLLPAYVCAIPALAYHFIHGALNGRVWKWCVASVAVVMLLNTLPAGIHYLSRNKYLAVNYNDTVDFLVRDIRAHHSTGPARIFLEGVDPREGLGSYYILGEFLKHRGLPRAEFDLAANGEAACRSCPIAASWDMSDAYTVYSQDKPIEVKTGDYLVITADANMQVDEPYLHSLEQDYQLLFRTTSSLSVPLVTAKTAVKHLLLTASNGNIDRELIVGRNLRLDPDYFVYVRR